MTKKRPVKRKPVKKGALGAKRTTPSGLEVKPLYTLRDYSQKASMERPGRFPYTRGIHESMYRGRLWTMRQYAGFGSASEANARYHYLLSQGSTGISIAFDLPTQMGRDSDHPLAQGEVGRVGVAISTLEDMELLLKGIPLDRVSISMTINATASILLALLLVVAEKNEVPWSALKGTIQNDILNEYIARGTYIFPPASSLRLVTDTFEYCAREVPEWNTISISGYHIREAGSTAVEEIAFTLGNGIAYVEAALARGLKIDSFAPHLAFFFNCHNDFFEEIVKFRAARRLWATIMKSRFKAKDPRSMMLRFHTQTAGSSLTAQQPLNNVARTTVQALAAVMGGTQSLHTNAFDEALGLPTEESARLALRTQQIIAHESGVVDVVEPLGGSYLIESWTDRMVEEVQKEIKKIDSLGGMVRAIEEGVPQGAIERSAYRYQQDIESGARVIVGLNKFKEERDVEPSLLRISPEIEERQVARLLAWRASRSSGAVSETLASLRVGARTKRENLMPFIVDAVRVGATVGEISDVLRDVFGEYRG